MERANYFRGLIFIAVSFLSACGAGPWPGTTATPPVAATPTTPNTQPVASAAIPSSAPVLLPLTLDASTSSDADGNSLTYKWTLLSKPTGSTATLPSSTTNPVISFTPDKVGTFGVQLIVNDGLADSTAYSATINVYNTPPVADVLPSIAQIAATPSIPLGQSFTLTATGSSDADGQPLTYEWTVVSKPTSSTLNLSGVTTPTVSVPGDVFGSYTIQLRVNDGWEWSAPASFSYVVAQKQVSLSYQVVDAEYSQVLDKIVMVTSGTPSKLITFDPSTDSTTELALPLAPSSVSIGPDGVHAAIGYNGYVSYVDLQANTLIQTWPTTTDVLDVVLAGNGYIYAFPRIDQWVTIHSINVATGTETTGGIGIIYAGTLAKLDKLTGTSIYGVTNGLSPSNIEKYDISGGTATYAYPSPYWGDFPVCGNLWISEDGARIFTACGNVFKASSTQSLDMIYNGALPSMPYVQSLDNSAETGLVVAVPGNSAGVTDADTKVEFFDYSYLAFQKSDDLAVFYTPTSAYMAHGQFVFLRSDGHQYFVIAKADAASGLINNYAILESSVY